MISIRLFLVSVILACWVLISFVVLLKGYEKGAQSTKLLLDEQLKDVAKVLMDHPTTQDGYAFFIDEHFSYLVLDKLVLLPLLTEKLDIPFAQLESGFSYTNARKTRWRTYAQNESPQLRWVFVGQVETQRSHLIEDIVLSTLAPILAGIPIAVVSVWFIVGLGLRPLQNLSKQLHNKQPSNLDSLVLNNPPHELTPVVDSLNQLLERLSLAFEREKTFVANAAHELRTPVSNLKIHLHNLRDEIDKESEHLIQLNQTTDHLAHLVEQLLVLHQNTPELLGHQSQVLEVDALLQDIIAQYYLEIDQHGHEIELMCEPMEYKLYRFAFQSMVSNLLSNAIKYTPVGGKIIVSAWQQENALWLSIEDSGPGIKGSDQQRVLKRFIRLETASSKPGSGLGLAIVSEAANIMGATMRFDKSTSLGGLMVTIKIPDPTTSASRRITS